MISSLTICFCEVECLIWGAPEGTQMLAPKNKGRGRDEKTIPYGMAIEKHLFIIYL